MDIIDFFYAFMKLIESSRKAATKTDVALHKHPNYEWHYVLAGNAVMQIGNQDHPINAGDLFLINPKNKHGVAFRSTKQWLVQLIFKTELKSKDDKILIKEWNTHHKLGLCTNIGLHWKKYIEKIDSDFQHNNSHLVKVAELNLQSIIHQALSKQPLEQTNQLHTSIQKALKYFEANITKFITLDQLAKAINLNKSYLTRLFQSQLGQPPLQYFMCQKMELAASKLECTNLNINEIAYSCGFADPFHFSRRFKLWSGKSPKQYRKHTGNNSN